MDKPLTKWYCDVCGGVIDDVKKGYVIWRTTNAGHQAHDFKIIHQNKCDLKSYHSSAALEDFLGQRGLAYLLAKLSHGPVITNLSGQGSPQRVADFDEYTDFVRRLQTPYYEEARRSFGNPEFLQDFNDSNEVYPYLPENLEKIVKRYGGEKS